LIVDVGSSDCILSIPNISFVFYILTLQILLVTLPRRPLHPSKNSNGWHEGKSIWLCAGTGHFHLLIDAEEDYPFGMAIPFDDIHLHFGKGQMGTDLELTPGKHTLTLQFANAVHESYGPEYRKSISVNCQ
jgi:hypothetical protein